MKNRIIIGVVAIIATSGCATHPLTAQESAVRILRKSDAPTSCRELGKVVSGGLAAWSEDGREENLKRETAKAGGDTVTIDRYDENNTIYGTAFKCGEKTETAKK